MKWANDMLGETINKEGQNKNGNKVLEREENESRQK